MRRALLTVGLLLAIAAPASAADPLYAGAGRADITPPTGYYMMGWVRTDAKLVGQHTRLFARVIVLRQGDKKVALVAGDLGAWPGGLVKHAAEMVKDRGFSETNVLASASHTHAAATGFYNFGTYNTAFMQADNPAEFKIVDTAADRQLYTFMVNQVAAAIRRADDDLAPARAGWGSTELLALTANRSIEAHLAGHGINVPFGQGSVAMDPLGYAHTIDPQVNVLRVDKVRRGKSTPIGIWATFADHGTVNKYQFNYYNADHHGSAARVAEAAIRREARAPSRQEVVNVYGNSDEGDMSAGLTRDGPAAADYVGRAEAKAMVRAWRQAGKSMSKTPAIDMRWTRVCFCGQETPDGAADSKAVAGLPLFTGSEEGRGPLYDETQVPFEGRTGPDRGAQGNKIQITDSSDGVPKAVPLLAIRIADRLIVSVPGEMTVGMGERVRNAVMESAKAGGITRAVISGLANEYVQYFTAPEEYRAQHYEGGSQLYGTHAANVLKFTLADLSKALVEGRPAPEPYAFDPTNGVTPDGPPFPDGADTGTATKQPDPIQRLERAQFAWTGGERGYDRPVDRAFVTIQRRVKKRWRAAYDDLGQNILWSVDASGGYVALWEAPLSAKAGTYRFHVTGKKYTVDSAQFKVAPMTKIQPSLASNEGGRAVVQLAYPKPVVNVDLTWRHDFIGTGKIIGMRIGRKKATVKVRNGGRFVIKAKPGQKVTIPRGAARDRFGNRNAEPLSFTAA